PGRWENRRNLGKMSGRGLPGGRRDPAGAAPGRAPGRAGRGRGGAAGAVAGAVPVVVCRGRRRADGAAGLARPGDGRPAAGAARGSDRWGAVMAEKIDPFEHVKDSSHIVISETLGWEIHLRTVHVFGQEVPIKFMLLVTVCAVAVGWMMVWLGRRMKDGEPPK